VRITYLTEEQSAGLLEATREHRSPHLYLFTAIALETSMRKNEILEIQLKNIDLARHLIFIPHAKRGPREQPITRKLAELLRPQWELAEPDQTWLFPSKTSESGHITNIERAFREAVRRAGLDVREVCRHTLRHTVITHLVQAGVDLPTVQRISGHKTLQMVVRYAHQNGAHVQAAMDKLETRMHGKLTSSDPVPVSTSDQGPKPAASCTPSLELRTSEPLDGPPMDPNTLPATPYEEATAEEPSGLSTPPKRGQSTARKRRELLSPSQKAKDVSRK